MIWSLLINCTLIVIARIVDVALGSLRTVSVVNGQRGLAWIFGLLEVTIWVFVVSTVVTSIQNEPAYGIAYAVGAATGNFLGVTLMRWLPVGEQVVRVFTRSGLNLLTELHSCGFRVTQFQGEGRDGAVTMLFVQVRRNRASRVVTKARELDPECFYTIDDIRIANVANIASPSLPSVSTT